jgi:hypothetical protein
MGNTSSDRLPITGAERGGLLALVLLAIFIRVWMLLMDHPHTPGGDEGLFIKIANSIVCF